MENIKEQVVSWLNEAMEDSSYFLLEVSLNERRQHFSVLIDGDKGVLIEQCVDLSRLITQKLEETLGEEHPYDFEVSSPGADRPLHMLRQYPQHVGRNLEVTLKDGTSQRGRLKSVEGALITLTENQKDKSKKNIGKDRQIAFPDIVESKVIIKI